MSLIQQLRPGGKHGIASTETRDPVGYAVTALSRLARSELLDRLGLRKQAEAAVYSATRGGFRTITSAGRAFTRAGQERSPGERPTAVADPGVFDLTPSEDEQLLVDVVSELASEVLRPAAAEADETCDAPEIVLRAGHDVGLPILGLPEALGGITEERSVVAGALVAEALAHGDLGLAVACLAPGSVATAIGLWGSDAQQQTYLPAFTEGAVPAAAIALTEPTVLFDVLSPATTAVRTDAGFVLNGLKSAVPRGADADLFVVGASLDGAPALFLVESGAAGLEVEADPAMGVRGAGLTRLHLRDVTVDDGAVLGATDGTTYAQAYVECVRLARLAWCALGVGVGQAVLDYVTPYVKEREAFGEPVAHRQSVAFMVADMAIELQAMRLLTWKAAGRAATGKDISRDVALARQMCADKGMQIGLDGVQLLGGHGFVKEHPVERWYRDLRSIGIMEGAVLI